MSLQCHAVAHMSGTGGKTTWRTALVNYTAYQYSTSTPLETSGDHSIALETSGDPSKALETSGDPSKAQDTIRYSRTPLERSQCISREASASREKPVHLERSQCISREASASREVPVHIIRCTSAPPLCALNTHMNTSKSQDTSRGHQDTSRGHQDTSRGHQDTSCQQRYWRTSSTW